MFLVDFVVLNRDRHGSNIEIIDGAPVPLFDHGLSLMALQDPAVWNHWSGDIVNNFIGTPSLKGDLKLIPIENWPNARKPDISVLDRFSDFWDSCTIDVAKKMAGERWEFAENLRRTWL